MLNKRLVVICILLLLCSCPSPIKHIKDSSIPFQRPYYSVLPPQGDNWYYVQGDQAGQFDISFAKKTESQTHTIAGLISEIHAFVKFDTPEEFFKFIRKNKEMNMDPRRFNVIDYEIVPDDKFGDYSIRYHAIAEDHKASNRRYNDFLALHIYGYTFIHPNFDNIIIDISYSERGLPEEIDPNFNAEAENFINGINLKGIT